MCTKISNRIKQIMLMCLMSVYIYNVSGQSISTFENLSLPADSMWCGSDLTGGFNSGAARFINNFTDWGGGYTSWDGFAYSNRKDTVTSGYDNQYSTFAGNGSNNSSNFAIGYCYPTTKIRIQNSTHPKIIHGVYVTNNSYAGISMRNGDAFSKKFGGTSGTDPDWFKLSIWGYQNGQHTDTIEYYLADFRFANNDSDYIVKDWRWVDLTSLGNADSLEFALSSTDNGMYGMNTPGYFCIDNFTIDFLPENETGNDSYLLTECNSYTFNLDTFFIDIDTPDSSLYYEIISNSTPWIFNVTLTDNLLDIHVNCATKSINTMSYDTLVIRVHSLFGSTDFTYYLSADILGIVPITEYNHIKFFPNPASDFIEIFPEGKTRISIFNMFGNTVWSGIIKNRETINISQFPSGIYFISSPHRVYKFIKN